MSPFERQQHAARTHPTASPPGRGRETRAAAQQTSEHQRIRIFSAMVTAASRRGGEPVRVSDIIALAGVSRKTFYALFADREDCLRATIEEGVALAAARASAVDDPEARWVDRLRAGLHALLGLFEEESELARLCVAQALIARAAHPRLDEVLEQLAGFLDRGQSAPGARTQPPALAAEGVLGGALGLIHARLIATDSGSLLELSNPLMSMIVLPYLGRAAAHKEQSRPEPARSRRQHKRTPKPPEALDFRLTHRTMTVLAVIAAQSELSNSEIAGRAGISDQGQISKLLARLDQRGLIENMGRGQARGAANAWRLTRAGRQLQRTLSGASLRVAR
jgi:AcrR family transcriptional regulator